MNGEAVENAADVTGTYRLNLNNITQTTHVVANEQIDPKLIRDGKIDPSDRYTPAIMKWLETGRSNGNDFENPEGPVTLGHYKGLWDRAQEHELSLKTMYWLDLDPTRSNWWVRSGFTEGPIEVRRKYTMNSQTTLHLKNRKMTVKMYYSNETGRAGMEVRRPTRLQGLGGEMSDTFTGNWTSETFKVLGKQLNGLDMNEGFLPVRNFIFNGDSFDSDTFEAKIEVLDPLSAQSPGHSYGWDSVGVENFLFKFLFDENLQTGAPVEMLKKDSLYDNLPLDD